MRSYYVYILQCSDGTYYTGVTNNIERRLDEHASGKFKSSYVAFRLPITLVYACEFDDIVQAIEWEKRVKDWNRKKKEALIAGNFEQLPKLAECRNGTHYLRSRSRLRSN